MELRVEQGSLLAAWPDLQDPNFMHTVLLICQHADDGAYGLVVNRCTELGVNELFGEHPILSGLDFPVHVGGPVDHGVMQFIHTVPDEIPGGLSLAGENLWLGGDFEALARFLLENPERALGSVRLFLGYSGWGEGQLDEELRSRTWVPAPLSIPAIFGTNETGTWRRVMRSAGKGEGSLGDLPPDPTWN